MMILSITKRFLDSVSRDLAEVERGEVLRTNELKLELNRTRKSRRDK